MKRILPAFLAVILALALTGCAGGAPAASPGPSAADPAPTQAAPAPTQTAQPAEEQEADARPALATQIENLGQYDTIFLGYPNWWGDMPQALYTFLESYDLSGKTIIPFCPHGGSGFSRTQSTIAELQPNATVREDGLTLSRNDVADSAEQVTAWAQGLGL